MDSQLKGLILNCTLKFYTMTPIESNNVFDVTMKFYGGYKYKSPGKRRWDRLRKERFLAKFKRDPLLVPIPFLGARPIPFSCGLGWSCQFCHCHCLHDTGRGDVEDMKDLCHQWDPWHRRLVRLKKEWGEDV